MSLCLAPLCCNIVTDTMAAVRSAPECNPDGTPPMMNAVALAAAHARAIHCVTPSRKAIIVINELVEIARFEDGDANGLASIRVSNRPRIAGLRKGCETHIPLPAGPRGL